LPTLAPGRVAQLARFCLVGLTCYVLNILMLAALCELLGMHYIVAYVIVFFLGCAVGYWLNKHFTFSLRAPLDRAAMARYILVNVGALIVSTAALHVLVQWMHVWYLAAITLIAAVNAPLSFIAHRLVTYRIAT
jgi:putative flippase GtrA